MTRPELALPSWASSRLSGIVLDDLEIAEIAKEAVDAGASDARATNGGAHAGPTVGADPPKQETAADFDVDFFSGGADAPPGAASGPAAAPHPGIFDMFAEMDMQPAPRAEPAALAGGGAPTASLDELVRALPDYGYLLAGTLQIRERRKGEAEGEARGGELPRTTVGAENGSARAVEGGGGGGDDDEFGDFS